MSILASCGASIKFHNWPAGVCLGNVEVGDENLCVKNIAWCNQGRQLIAVPSNGRPVIIRPLENIANTSPDPKNLQFEDLDIERISVVDFSKLVNSLIAVGTLEGEVHVYDVRQKHYVSTYSPITRAVQFLQYSDQDTLLAAGSGNGQIVLYNSKNIMCATFLVPHSYSLSAMSFHQKNSNLLAGASKEGIVTVWNTNNGHMVLSGKYHDNIVSDVAFHSSCRNIFASVGLDHKFICYDLRMKECAQSQFLENELAAVAFMPYRDEMAVASVNGHLICFDRRKLCAPISTIVAHNKPIKKIAFQTQRFRDYTEQNVCNDNFLCDCNENESITNVAPECPASGDCTTLLENKIPCGLEMLPTVSSEFSFTRRSLQNTDTDDLLEIKNDVLKDVRDLCQRFEDRMNEYFFESKIEISKRFIAMEEEMQKKKEALISVLKSQANLNRRLRKAASSTSQSRYHYNSTDKLLGKRSSRMDLQQKKS